MGLCWFSGHYSDNFRGVGRVTFRAKRIDLNKCIEIAREKKGLTLKYVAMRAGRDPFWLRHGVRRYSPHHSTVIDICGALNLGFIELLTIDHPDFECKSMKSLEVDLSRCVQVALRRQGLTKKQAAERVGRRPHWMYGILSRDGHGLRTMHLAADAVGMELIDLLTICER